LIDPDDDSGALIDGSKHQQSVVLMGLATHAASP
jgi:hypothetical protein